MNVLRLIIIAMLALSLSACGESPPATADNQPVVTAPKATGLGPLDASKVGDPRPDMHPCDGELWVDGASCALAVNLAQEWYGTGEEAEASVDFGFLDPTTLTMMPASCVTYDDDTVRCAVVEKDIRVVFSI